MLDVDQSLDAQYCRSDDCAAGRGSNFRFVVPLDVRFGHHSLTLDFDLDLAHLQVVLCHWQGEAVCRSDRAMNVTTHGDTGFTLPVGYYSLSMYNLRVAPALVDAVSLLKECVNSILESFALHCAYVFIGRCM